MRKGGGKPKGNAFERLVCKGLSLWITGGQQDDVLWRSAISGGRATVHAKRGKKMAHVAGDICSVHPAGDPFTSIFYVEAKFYANLGMAPLVFKQSGTLWKFWVDETVKPARLYNKLPMLIFKQNQFDAMVALESDVTSAFNLQPRVIVPESDLNLCLFIDFLATDVKKLQRWKPEFYRRVPWRAR